MSPVRSEIILCNFTLGLINIWIRNDTSINSAAFKSKCVKLAKEMGEEHFEMVGSFSVHLGSGMVSNQHLFLTGDQL